MNEFSIEGTFEEDGQPWGLDTWVSDGKFNIATSTDGEAINYSGAEMNSKQVSLLIDACLHYLARIKNGELKDDFQD